MEVCFVFRIERLLLNLGARPDRRGYDQTVIALGVLLSHPEEHSVQRIYQRAGAICGLSPLKIDEGVQQTIADIWKHQREIPGLPLRINERILSRYHPSNKVFLYAIAAQIRIAGYDEPFGLEPFTR